MYHHFYKQLEERARATFPSIGEVPNVAWDHLISPLELKLPASVYETARAAIAAFYRASRLPAYQAQLAQESPVLSHVPPNKSVLMAYDFHTDESGGCSLVEINTNASGFLLAALTQATHENTDVAQVPGIALLREAFAAELTAVKGASTPSHIVITDDDLLEQKMLVEFLMYRDWFIQQGWQAELCDAAELTYAHGQLQTPKGFVSNLVYNRTTDFYLDEDRHAALRQAFVDGAAAVSPQPREYWLLADKQRLIQMTEAGFLARAGVSEQDAAAIQAVLIPTFDKSAWPSEDAIWAERRHLFFKPKRSYGGKSVYRGESVSRKVFERLMKEDILIQRFRPAQRVPTDDPRSVLNNWKFDLRFYVYGDQIQLVCARVYQGQVTNFSSPMGGFTFVKFE